MARRETLSRTRRRLECWRERSGGPGRPIPERLWDEAVQVARREGIEATARALRLDRKRLARRLELSSSASDERDGVGEGFIELDARGVCTPGQTVLQFEGRDGERLQIALGAACAVDVADLARAFWSRSS